MNVDAELVRLAIARVAEMDYTAYEGQEWLLYRYKDNTFASLWVAASIMCYNTVIIEVSGGGQVELRLIYHAKYRYRGYAAEITRNVWQEYLANLVDFFDLPSPTMQEAVTGRVSSTRDSAVVASISVEYARAVKVSDNYNSN